MGFLGYASLDFLPSEILGRVLHMGTGRLAATLREKYPDLDVDTVQGGLLTYKALQETMEVMIPYDLVVVEEVGQLSQLTFERIMNLWEAAEKVPTVTFVGDFWQLPGVEPTKATNSPMWHSVRVSKRTLHTMRRCKCEYLKQALDILRTGKPSKQQLRKIMNRHYALPIRFRRRGEIGWEPTVDDIYHILQETPTTMFLTISRRAAAKLNNLAVECLFHDKEPLAVLPTDPESNTDNYERSTMLHHEPLMMQVYEGCRIMLTKNLNKKIGFVNGMGATVLGMDKENLIVRTDQGRRLALHPWTSEKKVVHFPFRLGYASTLHKVQGATLQHITVWLDVPNMPAAGYVALSRVEYDAHWKFLGNPGVHHFTPARF